MKIAIIENEFGDVGVDDGLLKANKKLNTDEEVVEMLNGSICWTDRDLRELFVGSDDVVLERLRKVKRQLEGESEYISNSQIH